MRIIPILIILTLNSSSAYSQIQFKIFSNFIWGQLGVPSDQLVKLEYGRDAQMITVGAGISKTLNAKGNFKWLVDTYFKINKHVEDVKLENNYVDCKIQSNYFNVSSGLKINIAKYVAFEFQPFVGCMLYNKAEIVQFSKKQITSLSYSGPDAINRWYYGCNFSTGFENIFKGKIPVTIHLNRIVVHTTYIKLLYI